MGETKQADDLLASFAGKYVKEVEYHYQVGLRHDLRSDYDAAIASYEKALAIDPSHVSSMFRLGYIADLRGDEDEAIKFYERCLTVRPAHVNALINLGVLYEDSGRYDDAVSCFERVLQWNPNHERAGLFLRDAEASLTMYYDEELERQVDRQNKVLEIPVTDFELSVRSRNCLERMNVKSLGDLTHITEPDLLSYKNFGETSLSEVKAMMTSRGLRLGQALEKDSPHPKAVPVGTRGKTEGDGVKSRPIGELELSVRSRKCMQRLAIATVGDLCDRSEDELLDCKNFGQTSLNEIRQKLANLGLKLKENK
jgi:DNA-directed RNA polymerase subunit alpha